MEVDDEAETPSFATKSTDQFRFRRCGQRQQTLLTQWRPAETETVLVESKEKASDVNLSSFTTIIAMRRAITKQNCDLNPLFNIGTPIISAAAHAPI